MDRDLLSYLSVVDHNVKAYLLHNSDICKLAIALDEYLLGLYDQVEATKGLAGDGLGVLMLHFTHTSHRSLRNSLLCHMQGGVQEGQLILRLGLEAASYAFIIHKKPALATAWLDKDNPKLQGDYLAFKKRQFPKDMPHRRWFLDFIDKLNEEMSHPNIYNRAPKTSTTADHWVFSFIDRDERFVRPHVFALLDSWMKILEVYRAIFAGRLVLFTKETADSIGNFRLTYDRIRASFAAPPAAKPSPASLIVVPRIVVRTRKRK